MHNKIRGQPHSIYGLLSVHTPLDICLCDAHLYCAPSYRCRVVGDEESVGNYKVLLSK